MSEESALTVAYNLWVSLFPGNEVIFKRSKRVVTTTGTIRDVTIPQHWAGACCTRLTHFKHEQKLNGVLVTVPLPDEQVCARERAWRAYVRLRDDGIEGMN